MKTKERQVDMRTTSLAVCIPSYNHDRFIESCVWSVINQEHRVDQIIVRDDNSSDTTLAKAAKFGSEITIHSNSHNLGLAANYRKLIADASTSHLVILSSDDQLRSSFSRVVMRSAETADCLATGRFEIGSNWEDFVGYSGLSYLWRSHLPPMRKAKYFLSGCGYSISGSLWNRAWLASIPELPEDAGLATDWFWALFTAAYGNFKFDPRPLHLYRMHGKNTSHSDPARWRSHAVAMLEHLLNHRLLPKWADPLIVDNLKSLYAAESDLTAIKAGYSMRDDIRALVGRAIYKVAIVRQKHTVRSR